MEDWLHQISYPHKIKTYLITYMEFRVCCSIAKYKIISFHYFRQTMGLCPKFIFISQDR